MTTAAGTRLPQFEPGLTLVVSEQWKGRLWAASPHRVIESSPAELVTFVPEGTTAVVATNRGLPQAAVLDRSARKLLALETMIVYPRSIRESPTKLHFYAPGRWSRVNLGWNVKGEFTGWYVNFERPVRPAPDGVCSKDLALDMFVNPDGRWHWKDREEFDEALARGIFAESLRAQLMQEQAAVLKDLAAGDGAFDPAWTRFAPDSAWESPVLPVPYLPDSPLWAHPDAKPPPQGR